MCFKPAVKQEIGLETEDFLEDGKTEDLPIIDVGSRSCALDELSVLGLDARCGESIIQCAIDGDDEVLEADRRGDWHTGPLNWAPPTIVFIGIICLLAFILVAA